VYAALQAIRMASKLLKFRKFSLVILLCSTLSGGVCPAAAQEIFAEPDQTLFAVMAAINAAGYDEGADRMERTPIRAAVRKELAGRSIMYLEGDRRGRLLDVGCGNGQFLSRMKGLGWDVYGTEPDPQAAGIAKG